MSEGDTGGYVGEAISAAKVAEFPRRPTTEYTSHIGLLRCQDCREEWFGLYHSGMTLADLHCPFCESYALDSLRGERQVVFYEYG